jgi:glycosyltransferase involved in cell wall biosynthesis
MIAVVIPAFNVAGSIDNVLRELPANAGDIIVVDDGSTDGTAAVVERRAREDGRIRLLRHDRNRGVGAAMVTGYRAALETPARIVVKVDGDGQMPVALLPALLRPLLTGEADYAKGNRFRDFQAIRKMPAIRRFGNVVLSFLAKAATGYWQCFDPANGFVAIRTDVLRQLPLSRIASSYFFEISMLCELYLLGAVVREAPMPARYNGEPSSLSVPRVLREFPARLVLAAIRRMALRNFVYDFNVQSLEIVAGLILFFAGAAYGGYNWVWYARHGLGAPTGTVVLPALLLMAGFQLLLSAVALDLQAVPREPINEGPITERLPS